MYEYKDDICIIPDEIKRMSEEEIKAEIARIEQSSTPKNLQLHYITVSSWISASFRSFSYIIPQKCEKVKLTNEKKCGII